MKKIMILAAVLLNGCATTMYAGVGYDVGGSEFRGVADTDASTVIFRQDAWSNPVGIAGLRYPMGENFELDYRHISSFGSHDLVNSDVLSVIFKIGGSRQGWGMEPE